MEQRSTQIVDLSTPQANGEQSAAHDLHQVVTEMAATCTAALQFMRESGLGCQCAYESGVAAVSDAVERLQGCGL